MRVDEHYKDAVTNIAVEQRKAKTGRTVARVQGTVDPAVVKNWEKEDVNRYIEASCKVLLPES
eukprot:1888859-Amphidinium_carterae.1